LLFSYSLTYSVNHPLQSIFNSLKKNRSDKCGSAIVFSEFLLPIARNEAASSFFVAFNHARVKMTLRKKLDFVRMHFNMSLGVDGKVMPGNQLTQTCI
jgi:hypothetical protein